MAVCLRVIALSGLAALTACASGRDYTGVDPVILKACTEESRSLKIAADRGYYQGLDIAPPGQETTAQTILEDARRGREMQRKGPGKDLGDWPLTVLVDQCLVENGQPIPDDAAAELTRWTSGEALAD